MEIVGIRDPPPTEELARTTGVAASDRRRRFEPFRASYMDDYYFARTQNRVLNISQAIELYERGIFTEDEVFEICRKTLADEHADLTMIRKVHERLAEPYWPNLQYDAFKAIFYREIEYEPSDDIFEDELNFIGSALESVAAEEEECKLLCMSILYYHVQEVFSTLKKLHDDDDIEPDILQPYLDRVGRCTETILTEFGGDDPERILDRIVNDSHPT